METTTKAAAGTLESSDARVLITPNVKGLNIKLESSVYDQYGQHIIELIKQVAQTLGLENATIQVVDKGALDCTIKARVETAYYRAIGQNQNLPWEVL